MQDAGQSDHSHFWVNSKLINDTPDPLIAFDPSSPEEIGMLRIGIIWFIQSLACASISLESRQRKLPLSLQGGVFFKGHKSGHFSIQNDTLETKLINWFAEADLLNFLTHRDDI